MAKNDLDLKIGAMVKQRRVASGVTQEQLAKMLGLTFQQVQKYESGKNRISAGSLKLIADFLKVNINEFYGEPLFIDPKTNQYIAIRVKQFLALPNDAQCALLNCYKTIAGA